jgi:hypothetical protein
VRKLIYITNCKTYIVRPVADVAELADALDSKSSIREDVWVRPPPSAPLKCVATLARQFVVSIRKCSFGVQKSEASSSLKLRTERSTVAKTSFGMIVKAISNSFTLAPQALNT